MYSLLYMYIIYVYTHTIELLNVKGKFINW